jgi:hypothetical protein
LERAQGKRNRIYGVLLMKCKITRIQHLRVYKALKMRSIKDSLLSIDEEVKAGSTKEFEDVELKLRSAEIF